MHDINSADYENLSGEDLLGNSEERKFLSQRPLLSLSVDVVSTNQTNKNVINEHILNIKE